MLSIDVKTLRMQSSSTGSKESEARDSASVASAPHLVAFSLQPHVQELRKNENGREPRLTTEAAPSPPRAAGSRDVAGERTWLEAAAASSRSPLTPPSRSPDEWLSQT